jgi:signal transduction histidine kinase
VSPTRLFRTSTFRLALYSVPLLLLGGWLVLAFVYFSTARLMNQQTNRTIEVEASRLLAVARERPERLTERIAERVVAERGSPRLYLLLAADGVETVGNFSRLDAVPAIDGRFEDTTVRRADREEVTARLLAARLADGRRLVVGRDLSEQDGFRIIVEESLAIAVVLTVLLSAAAGFITSRSVLARLDAVNSTAWRIFHGRIEERMPLRGVDDEFDHLAANLNAMLDRIEHLMRAMREVTDNIAHDLRSPLNRLRSQLEVTLLSSPSREESEAAIRAAIEAADSLLATFNALLTIAKIENAVARPAVRVDLAPLVADLVDLYAPLAEEKGLALTAEPPVEDASVPADRDLLFQALANLADNAIKYTPAGGQVTVSLRRADGGAEIAIADSGPGIPPDQREKVLDRFVRLDASRHTPGTGLGLSVVRAVAQYHGAVLRLEDNRPGLKVVIFLPAA